ncbi:MAG: molybdenum cofactor guanylyltransferase [Desulfotomaculaceae bacterium]|nr:molybdenum cofactor guanylyltransferase [Desulfotomaculaceae bacterium]
MAIYEAAGVILAGGKSRRMGSDKTFLEVGQAGMIQLVAAELQKVFKEILIAGGSEETGRKLGLKVVADLIPGGGPLSGIHAALNAASHDKCLVVPCDMPFLKAELAALMVSMAQGYDAAVPTDGVYFQPLFAVYDKSCIKAIEQALRAGRYKVVDFYPQVRVNYVNEKLLRELADTGKAFFNVNTPTDLQQARVMARETGRKTGE